MFIVSCRQVPSRSACPSAKASMLVCKLVTATTGEHSEVLCVYRAPSTCNAFLDTNRDVDMWEGGAFEFKKRVAAYVAN